MSKTKQQNLKEIAKRYGMYFIFLMAGIPLGSFGDVYFVDNPEATNFTVHDGLPELSCPQTCGFILNDDIHESEKQTLWNFGKVAVAKYDTVQLKNRPIDINRLKDTWFNMQIWTIKDDEPDKVYITQLLENHRILSKWVVQDFEDPEPIYQK